MPLPQGVPLPQGGGKEGWGGGRNGRQGKKREQGRGKEQEWGEWGQAMEGWDKAYEALKEGCGSGGQGSEGKD